MRSGLRSQTQSLTGPGVRQRLLSSPPITAVRKVVLYPVICPGTCSHTAGDVPPLSGAKPISILLERALQRGSKTPAQCCEEQTEALWGCPWEGAFAGPRNGRHVRSGRQRSQGSPLSPLSIVQNKHRCCIWM